MSWQGRLTNVALSYSHMISGGGGLMGAVKSTVQAVQFINNWLGD